MLQKPAPKICTIGLNSTPDPGASFFFVSMHDFWRRWLPSGPEGSQRRQ